MVVALYLKCEFMKIHSSKQICEIGNTEVGT